MRFDQLRTRIDALSRQASEGDRTLLRHLKDRLLGWRDSDEAVGQLPRTLDRWLGNTWFESRDLHAEVHQLIREVEVTVSLVPGMTLNERLSAFELLSAWDEGSDEQQEAIRRKLGAL